MFSSPFFPTTLLVVGAVLLWLIRRIPSARRPTLLVVRRALLLICLIGVFIALWTLNRPLSPVRFLFVFPATLQVDLSLRTQVSGWTRLFGMAMLWPALFNALSVWFGGQTEATAESPDWPGWLFCLAMAQFALLAVDWLTLTIGLLAFDLSLLMAFPSQQKQGWTFGANGLGTLALFAAALLSTLDGYNLALTAATPLSERALLLIIGAAILRVAPYPFHLWLSDSPASGRSAWHWPVHLISPLLGLYLLARLTSLLGGAVPMRYPLLAIGLVGCLVASLLTWLMARDQPPRALPFVALYQLNLTLLSWALEPHQASELWIGPVLLLAITALILHRDWIDAQGEKPLPWRDLIPGGIAAAALAGLPLTVGFFARAPLYRALLNARQIVGLVFFLSAEGLQIAALFLLWNGFRNTSKDKASLASSVSWKSWSGRALLVAPLFLLGAFPSLATQLAASGRPLPLSSWRNGWAPSLGLWAAFLIPWALGYGIYRNDPGWPAEATLTKEQFTSLLSLDWLHRAADRGLGQLRQALWSMGRLLHGEGYLAWVALSLLLIAVLFLGR